MGNNVPEGLLSAFSERKLIPVVAAGVSLSLKHKDGRKLFPSWPELLNLASNEIATQGDEDLATTVKYLVKVNKLKEAADLAKQGLVGGLWSKFFKKIFDIERNDIDLETLALPEAIWTLSDRIITLNYENVLRHACPRNYDLKELDNMSISSLADFSRDELGKPTVWHLHGRIDNLENIILTSESYCQLYIANNSTYQAALQALQEISGRNTLLFVGCSLDDAELLAQLMKVHDIFSGNVGPHYVLVREAESKLIIEKLKDIPVIKIITFSDFGQPLLEKIAEITNGPSSMDVVLPVRKLVEKSNVTLSGAPFGSPRIAVFCASPIGEVNDYSEQLKAIKGFKCEVCFFPLNTRLLNEAEGFNYIFILSNLIKNKVVVEDEALSSGRVSLKELIENIGNSVNDGVFVILNNQLELDFEFLLSGLELVSIPVLIFPKLGKDAINSFAFKIFKKNDLDFVKNCLVMNRDKFKFHELNTKPEPIKKTTLLPSSIDPKTTRHYIGRKTDLQNICRHIVNLKYENEFLTIKGSGGIGKTITVKKIVVALAERNQFPDGIDFIDCEFVGDYSSFVKKVAASFNLELAIDVKESIKKNFVKQEKLIVLDNVETLLHLNETQEIKDFIYFICDYACVVITSRELLNFDCEQVYELRNFSTDEAFELFVQQLGCEINDINTVNFVRTEIIEKLLDNNPLAIQIISNNVPAGKDLNSLKEELESDIFRKVSYSELFELDSVSDLNIERKKSLYASINFSYQHLSDSEKTAFEFLSLFPDGINMEHLKKIVLNSRIALRNPGRRTQTSEPKKNKKVDHKVTDYIIKELENKSMVQIDNGTIKLQSIVRKFAEHKLKIRSDNELSQFYREAMNYNIGYAEFLAGKTSLNQFRYSVVFNDNKMNFFKSFDYLQSTKLESGVFLEYLSDLLHLAVATSTCEAISHAFDKNISTFEFEESVMHACKLFYYSIKYYSGDFEGSSSKIKKMFPPHTVPSMEASTKVGWFIKRTLNEFYDMEGETVLSVEVDIELKLSHGYSYSSSLFKLGYVNEDWLRSCKIIDFFTLEALNMKGWLTDSSLDKFIATMYEKDHLNLMQVNYLKFKRSLDGGEIIDKQTIEKLIVINPFTLGLRQLMFAFFAQDLDEKINLFVKAIDNLKHIRYYYVEALLYFARTLQFYEHPRFLETYALGLDLACSHHFLWLRYQFEILVQSKVGAYCIHDYPFPEIVGLDDYVCYVIRHNRDANLN